MTSNSPPPFEVNYIPINLAYNRLIGILFTLMLHQIAVNFVVALSRCCQAFSVNRFLSGC